MLKDGQLSNIDAGKKIYLRAVEECLKNHHNGGVRSYRLKEGSGEIYFSEIECLSDPAKENVYSLSVKELIFTLDAINQIDSNGSNTQCSSESKDYALSDGPLNYYFSVSVFFLRHNQDKIWVDLFTPEFYDLDSSHSELLNLIRNYHLVNKLDPKNSPERRRLLKNIKKRAEGYADFPKNSALQLLRQKFFQSISAVMG